MKDILCPLDGRPCDPACPEQYHDQSGCWMTTAQKVGAQVLPLGGDTVAVVYLPGQEGGDEQCSI